MRREGFSPGVMQPPTDHGARWSERSFSCPCASFQPLGMLDSRCPSQGKMGESSFCFVFFAKIKKAFQFNS